MRYFGSNNFESVAESLVEVEMNWVEVGGRFSNTLLKFPFLTDLIQIPSTN